MKAKDKFALALRIIGVLGIIYVLRTFVRNSLAGGVILIVEMACAIIGLYLIRGAPQLGSSRILKRRRSRPKRRVRNSTVEATRITGVRAAG